MRQMISAENYKLRKDFSFKVLSLCALVGFIGLGILMKIVSAMNGASSLGFNGATAPYSMHIFTTIFLMMLAVFTGTNTVAEFDKGMIKNALSSGIKKNVFYFSKFYIQMVATIVIVVISTLAFFGVNAILQGFGDFPKGNLLVNTLLYYLVFIVNLIAYISFFLMVAFLIRGIGGTISICIIFVSLESVFVQMLSSIDIDLVKTIITHMPFVVIMGIKPDGPWSAGTVFSQTVGALAVIAITTSIGLLSFVKRDVK